MTSPVGRPYLLSKAQLRSSLQVDASELAMQRVWRRLQSGKPLRIGVLGSSVAMSGGCQAEYQPHLRCVQFDGVQVHKRFARGYGVVDEEMRSLLHNSDRPVRGFVLQVLDWINATWPNREHRIENAAVDAWTAKAIEPCLLSNERITTADLLFLELGSQAWHPSQAAASERIVRKLLRITSNEGPPPALLMVTTRQWCGHSVHGLRRREKPVILRTWDGIEDVFARLCNVYGMACLSLRDAIFHDVVAGRANFTVADVAADCLHPEQSRYGFHYMADMIIHFLRRSWRLFREHGGRHELGAMVRGHPRTIAPPLLEANKGSEGRMAWRCYQLSPAATKQVSLPVSGANVARRSPGATPILQWQSMSSMSSHKGAVPVTDTPSCDALRRCALKFSRTRNAQCFRGRGHWQHCTRTLALRAAFKPGIVSMMPGAMLRFQVDALAPVSMGNGNTSRAIDSAVLALTYLTSYEDMGVAIVTCESGCRCNPQVVDALQPAQSTSSVAGRRRGGTSLTRNVSVAAVVEIQMTEVSHLCVLKLSNMGRHHDQAEIGSADMSTRSSKWKLMQVRVGWDLGVS